MVLRLKLYFELGWDYVNSETPNPTGLQETRVVYWTNVSGTVGIDVIVEPTGEFPIGSVWRSKSENTWKILEVDRKQVTMRQIDSWGNRRIMELGDKVVRGMKRLI